MLGSSPFPPVVFGRRRRRPHGDRVRGDPGFIRLRAALGGGGHGSSDAFPSGGGDSLSVEDGQGQGARAPGRQRQRPVKPNVVYPPLVYPGIDMGLGWYPGIDLGLYFGGWGGWGWGGWGWNPNWYGGNMFIDNSFFNRYGFRNFQGGGALGNSVWMHSPEHRLGVPYANRGMAGRYAPNGADGRSGSAMSRGSNRGARAPQQQFGNKGFEQRGSTGNRSVFGGYQNGGMTRMQSDRGFSSMGAGRTGGFGGGGGMRGGGGGMQGGGGHGGGGRR